MSAQQEGMIKLAKVCRAIIPPQLDFVVVIYRPQGPIAMASCMARLPYQDPAQALARAREAAQAFIDEKPQPSFNPQS